MREKIREKKGVRIGTCEAGGGRQRADMCAQAHLCPSQQGFYFFVMLNGCFKRLKEI